jgi:peptidoglycan/LPS O-acetylase OafA/YrhL
VHWVDRASDLSFGVYLVHPLLLLWLFKLPWASTLPTGVTVGVATVLALVGSLLVTEVARRTPASLPLTGRPRRRSQKSPVGARTRRVEPVLTRKA